MSSQRSLVKEHWRRTLEVQVGIHALAFNSTAASSKLLTLSKSQFLYVVYENYTLQDSFNDEEECASLRSDM